MSKSQRPAALTFIFITLLIDVTGLGIIIPVVPQLIQDLTGEGLSAASRYAGWLTFTYAVMQFLCAPLVGALSDRFGRRPVLLASLIGFGLDYILAGFAPTIGWLFVARIVAGITGASFTTASAYIADVSPPEKRAQNFGLVGADFGAGFILGPAIGGFLGSLGPRVPFFVAAGLALANALYGFFILPESLTAENRRAFDWRRANPVGSLLSLRRYPIILSLTASLVCIYIAGQAIQSVWTFFTIERFGWSERWIGLSLAFIGLTVGGVQGGLTRVIIPKIGPTRAVYLGLSLYVLGFVLFAFASQSWMLFAFMIPYSLGGIAGPSLQGIISSQVPGNEQGELQGALTSLVSVTSIVGPPLMTNPFAYFIAPTAPVYFPGAPFLMGAVLTLLSLLLARRSLRKHGALPQPLTNSPETV
jgi:DHA1 family tetracycline resistance protein-like MFS transporter